MTNIKRRNPALVVLFSIITLGIYFIYWAIKTKEEMKSLGASIPTMWFIIVPVGNMYLLYKYCDGFSTFVKKDNQGLLWFILAIVCFPVFPVIAQIELNKLAAA
jgi:hypothetical protein